MFKVFLVDRNAPRLELGDAVTINVGANDLVSRLSEASSGDESHISTSDYGKTQKRTSSR